MTIFVPQQTNKSETEQTVLEFNVDPSITAILGEQGIVVLESGLVDWLNDFTDCEANEDYAKGLEQKEFLKKFGFFDKATADKVITLGKEQDNDFWVNGGVYKAKPMQEVVGHEKQAMVKQAFNLLIEK